MLNSIFAVTLISLTSLLILAFLSKTSAFSKYMNLFLALASGSLLGEVFIHIFPELFSGKLDSYFLFALLAIFMNYLVESVLNFKHCHNLEHEHHQNQHTKQLRLISSDVVHNLLDGITLFAGFSVSTELGITTTIAILFHEIPKEISSFAMILNTGFSKKKAITINLLTALAAFFGIFLAKSFFLENYANYLLSFVAGNFLYIALVDIFPELHENKGLKVNILKIFAFISGIAMMYAMKLIFN